MTSPIAPPERPAPAIVVSLPELTTMLIKRAGFHEGHYELSVVFSMSIGVFALGQVPPRPSTMTSLDSIALTKVEAPTPMSQDAAVVNPPPVARAKSADAAARRRAPKVKT